MHRIGFGSDIHRLEGGLPLILGGVRIESDLGAVGHSDADALTHAITDAILGALALGDIGSHFPDSDERWNNAESFVFLRFVVGLMKEHGYEVANLDATIHLERPKLRLAIDEMRKGIAEALETETNRVSIKAKTGEGVGEVGTRQAVSAEAIVLLQKI
ncbi:MAG TPA: 2-C-methyl-D-erythritol 2,4-cyclodiphosphate synthase [Pyrinomonadaceae bacterium]|jgi:2-C-methyl-D-erythritol 2,4-cyclodiphosphate synthase|nr:2-C-methyl-D-erythritol 2,4-cyclodiphosphate synthase [Pyrinomonadaceae bacterium]